jgi:hypothetical protein
MLLSELRATRRKKLERQIQLARSTIRDQRPEIARIVSSWNRIAKKINVAMLKYERLIEDLPIALPFAIQAKDLLDCIKSCQDDHQISPLDEIEAALVDHEHDLKLAAAASTRRRTKKEKKRSKVKR